MKTYEGIGRLASRLLTATVGSGCADCVVDFTRPQSSSILSAFGSSIRVRSSGVHDRKCSKAHIKDRRGKKSYCFIFSLRSVRVNILGFVYDGMYNQRGEGRRDPKRTHRDSHVKLRVGEPLIIYRSSDPFNRRSLKFIEGYLGNGKI